MDEWNEVIDYLEPIKLKEVSLEELLTYPYKEFLNNLQYFSKDELQAFLNKVSSHSNIVYYFTTFIFFY